MIAFLYYISYNINMENYQLESKIKNVTYGRGYVYSLQYHIVWVTKYRKPILVSEIKKEVKEYLLKTLKSLDMDPIAMEIMPDHIHLLVDCKPQLRLSDAIKNPERKCGPVVVLRASRNQTTIMGRAFVESKLFCCHSQ